MVLPNFMCIGAQKAGTTTLFDVLKNHPDVFLPASKEAHYYDIDDRYFKGLQWWSETFFKNYNNQKAVGVITPEYLFYPDVPERIHRDFNNNMKFIVLLRDPVKRAYSHYLMTKSRGLESDSFQVAINKEAIRIKNGDDSFNHYSYTSRSFYSEQVARYFKLFPVENFLFLIFEEDIVSNLLIGVNKVCDFLEIEKFNNISLVRSNEAYLPKYPSINKLLYTQNIAKRIIRLLIPVKRVRDAFSRFIDKNNRKPFFDSKLKYDEYRMVREDFFSIEINALESLLKRNLHIWRI